MDFHRIGRALVAVAALLAVASPLGLAGCATAPPRPDAAAPKAIGIEGAAHVIRVIDERTIVIGRGARHGLITARGLAVSPRPAPTPEQKTPQVRLGIRSAVADVVDIGPEETTLGLRAMTQPVSVGDYVAFDARIPAALQDDPVARCALYDVGFVALEDGRPLVSLAALIERGQAASDAAVDAMVAEIHAQAELAASVHAVPFDGGRFVGRTLSEAFSATSRDDVLAFLDFVASYPGKYITWEWRLVEVYATWLLNRAPAGDGLDRGRRIAALEQSAKEAVRRRDWAAATAAWRQVLALAPERVTAKAGLGQIEALSRAETALGLDPEDRAAQWDRARALAELGLSMDALAGFDALIAAGYRVETARRQRVYRLSALGRYAEASAELEALLAAKEDASLRNWLDYTRARARLADARGAGRTSDEADLQLVLGGVHEKDGSWDSALAAYRVVLDLDGATGAQRARAEEGQRRVERRSHLAEVLRFTLENVHDHNLGSARERVGLLVEGYDELGLASDADASLDAIVGAAGMAEEWTFQAELLARVAERRPGTPDPWTRLGWCRMSLRDVPAAAAAFERASALAPGDLWARSSRAWAYIALGRWQDAADAARAGAQDDDNLAIAMARVAVAQGDLTAARTWAARAAALAPARWGSEGRMAERLAALPARGDAKTALSRIRALVALALPNLAVAELQALDKAPADIRREAAWAIAESRETLVGGDWGLVAARIEGGTTPERRRVLAVWEAEAAYAREPSSAARRALAEALVAVGAFDRALAVIGGGTSDTTDEGGAAVDRTLLDVRARALIGLEGARTQAIATAASERGDWLGAAHAFHAATALFAKAGAPAGELGAVLEEAKNLSYAAQTDDARALAAARLDDARAEGNPLRTLDFEIVLARLELRGGAIAPLGAAYDRLLATCQALEREHCEAVVRVQRSDLESERGQADAAVADAEAALALWRGLRDASSARTATVRLASLRRLRGELREAASLAETAWRESTREDDRGSERTALVELGRIAIQLGDAEAAHRWLDAASAAAERDDDGSARAIAGYWLGRVALDLDGDPAVAAAALDRALRTFEARGEGLEAVETAVLLARAAPDRALALTAPLVERARGFGHDVILAEALEARARALLAARRAPEARPLADEAVAIGARIGVPEVQARVEHLAALLARDAGDEAAAADHFAAAARAVGATLTRTGGALPLGADDTRRVIDDAIAALYKAGRTADALEIIELQHLAKAGRLLDPTRIRTNDADLERSLSELGRAKAEGELARARLREEADKPTADQDPAARAALVQVTARSDQEIAALLMKLQRDHRGVYGALAVSPLTLVQQRAALPRDALVVDYFATADALYAFVVRRDDPAPKAFRIEVPRERLTRTIARYRQLLAQDGRLAEAAGRDLYGWLLAPIDDLVPAAKRDATTVVVIAEGPLQYVPFAALVASPAGAPTVYAVERWRLATALSTTVFALFEPPAARPPAPRILAFLDPTGELAGARDELDGVPLVTALRGAEATTAAFLAEAARYPILHFATHGQSDAADPLASGIRLAGGVLSVDAITGLTALRGHVRLVVLSACQTATEVADAADAAPDEVISTARGFAIAGVPSVVGSLWDVDDQATRALMQAFYAELADPKQDTLGALRAAQLRLLGRASPRPAIGDGAHSETERPLGDPRLWSGFQLIGDWR